MLCIEVVIDFDVPLVPLVEVECALSYADGSIDRTGVGSMRALHIAVSRKIQTVRSRGARVGKEIGMRHLRQNVLDDSSLIDCGSERIPSRRIDCSSTAGAVCLRKR